jgi:tryptophan synthase alpha chain
LLYYNIILQYGVDAFYARAAAVGVDAILVADVSLEEADDLVAAGRKHGVAPVFIATERTPADRLERIAAVADGYVYLVGRLGITGEQRDVNPALAAAIDRIKQRIQLPVLVGFGISEPAHVRAVQQAGADGAICGSAIVRRIAGAGSDRGAMLAEIGRFAREMKAATRNGDGTPS